MPCTGPESSNESNQEIQFIIAELHHPSIHGKTAQSARDIGSQIICTYALTNEDFMDGEHIDILDTMRSGYATAINTRSVGVPTKQQLHLKTPHSEIRNHENIVRDAFTNHQPNQPVKCHNSNHSFPRLIIGTITELDTGESIIDRRLDLGIVRLQRQFRKWSGR